MDLNYFIYRLGVERSRARDAASDEARRAHEQLAALYEQVIEGSTIASIGPLDTPPTKVH